MLEVIISRPNKGVAKALRNGLGLAWRIVITTDDEIGITFQIKDRDLHNHKVKERLTCWAQKSWIRAGIVGNFMVTNSKLSKTLRVFYQQQNRFLEKR
ncbi:MAG: hypothetical protein NTW50_01350 [Candidatus Berkelbacteria bacterium]|nr:hypothetical protein [Candidatus Berkelbacteria bacterium]